VRALILILFLSRSAFAQNVGDISFDPKTDDPKFQVCNPKQIWQGYQLKSDKDETSIMVAREFRSKFKTNATWKNENGLIRVRFMVNCAGVADRFRLLGLDFDLKEKQFSNDLSAHVLGIAKSISWPSRRAYNQTVDYYHHVSVRIVNGELSDVVQ
jgi:hypothetical protein